MSDPRTAERAAIIAQHFPITLRSGVHCDPQCSNQAMTRSAWAEHIAQALNPGIDAQTTDTYLLAVGSCIAVIEATTAVAVAVESDCNARVIREWAAKVVTAMRYATATITPGGNRV